MKRIIKNSIGSLSFILILILLLVVASKVLEPKNNSQKDGILDFRANGILSEPKNTIDVLFLGDSEPYCSVIPTKIWEKYGITSYVCATKGQKLLYSMEFLKTAFERQSPKVVFLDANAVFRKTKYSSDIYIKAGEKLPVLRYHDRWKTLKQSDWSLNSDYRQKNHSKGYMLRLQVDPIEPHEYMKKTDREEKIPQKNRLYLKKIHEFCKLNKAKLIIYSTPSTLNWNYARHNGITQFAKKLGVPYVDLALLTDEIPIDWSTDTCDKGDHLNYNGAVKVTEYLGKYINDLHTFRNKHGIDEYSEWDISANKFNKFLKKAKEKKALKQNNSAKQLYIH